MPVLANQHCLNHETREAACRCPECNGFFCRECVSEHEFRLLCAMCIAKRQHGVPGASKESQLWVTWTIAAIGILIAWIIFYVAGWTVLQFRDSVPVASVVQTNA